MATEKDILELFTALMAGAKVEVVHLQDNQPEETSTAQEELKQEHEPIGYMAFFTKPGSTLRRPVPNSFRFTREETEADRDGFMNTRAFQLLTALGLAPTVEVAPVFAE